MGTSFQCPQCLRYGTNYMIKNHNGAAGMAQISLCTFFMTLIVYSGGAFSFVGCTIFYMTL